MPQNSKANPLTRFVIFAVPRTGSNWLCSLLNSHPEILCHHEIFNPERIIYSTSYRDGQLNFGSVQQRDQDPLGVYGQIWEHPLGHSVVGFKFNRGQNQIIFNQVLAEPEIKKIILKRNNRVKTFVSEMIAEQTKEWESYPWSERKDRKVAIHVDEHALRQHIETNQRYFDQIIETLENSTQSYLELSYEKLSSPEEQGRILHFLGVSQLEAKLTAITSKQNSCNLRDLVTNFEELAELLQDIDLKEELLCTSF
jgi:LPS sulfotransferase NodH